MTQRKTRGIGDLAGKRIAIIPGTTTETAFNKFLREEFIAVETVRVKDHLEGVAALERGSPMPSRRIAAFLSGLQ